MKNVIILIIAFILLNNCIMSPSPKRDYYEILNNNECIKTYNNDLGYIYKNDKYILNLWVFSTPWKSIYFSTNIPVNDSVKLFKKNMQPIYLKKLDKQSINKLPYKVYNNDSIQVYSSTIKIADRIWYKKQNNIYYDTLKIEINNKYYDFILSSN